MARTRKPRRPPKHPASTATQARIQYLITGLAVGGLWLLNRDKSLLYHAVQMTVVMSALTALQILLQILLRRRAGAAPAAPGANARIFVRLLGAKLVLVAVAVGAEWLLDPVTARSNGIVAGGLVVLVTAFGSAVDRRAAHQATPATGPEQASLASRPPRGSQPERTDP